MEKLLKQRVEILAQEIDKMKSGGAGEGYTKAEADDKFLSKADASTALAGKQDSLDPTQLAAVNSGIDSTKVAQIETNKTNILYSLQTGANNLCPESQLTIISNSKTKSLTVNLPAGKYYISCNATLTGSILADGVFKNSAGTAIGTASGFDNGANVKSVTIADTATEFYFYSTDANASFDNLMIVPEVVWNAIDHNFRTAAISNADLTKLEAEDRAGLIECVDEGAKNIFKTFEASEITTVPATIAGLTFIRNADGSITLNGTNSTGSDVFIKIGVFNYEAGKEYVMGYSCIEYGNVNKAYAYSSDDYLASSYDPVRTHTYSSSGSAYVYIRVASDYQFVNATIYPMICIKAKYDISPNYESHALPNYDLTKAIIEQVDGGAKNHVNYNNTLKLSGSSTVIEANSDTSFTIIDTTTGSTRFYYIPFTVKEGDYIVSGCPLAGTDATYRVEVRDQALTQIIPNSADYGLGSDIMHLAAGTYCVVIRLDSTYATPATGIVFFPMICTIADWSVSKAYQSYRPSYQELYEMVLAIQTTRTATTRKTTKTKTNEE